MLAKLPPKSHLRGDACEYVLFHSLFHDGTFPLSWLHPSVYDLVRDLVDKRYVVYRRSKDLLVVTPRGRCYAACWLYADGWHDYCDYCVRCRGDSRAR